MLFEGLQLKLRINILALVRSIGSSVTRRAEEAAIENKPIINILAHLFLQVNSVSKGLNWSKNGVESTRACLYSVANAISVSSLLS